MVSTSHADIDLQDDFVDIDDLSASTSDSHNSNEKL